MIVALIVLLSPILHRKTKVKKIIAKNFSLNLNVPERDGKENIEHQSDWIVFSG